MKKSRLLLVLAASAFALVGCGQQATSSISSEGTSVVSSSEVSSEVSSSEASSSQSSSVKEKNTFALALAQDYSNATLAVTQSYNEGNDGEFVYEYVVDGYTVIYDEQAAANGDTNPYLYYHNYEGLSYLYFAPEKNVEGSKGAWLNKGAYNVDLSLPNTYFDLQTLLSLVSEGDVSYSAGYYFINSREKVQELNEKAFKFAWFNTLSDISFTVDNGRITSIIGFDDLNNEKNFVKIVLSNVGTTSFTASTLPEAPNANNVMEYWEYKGYDGPYQEKYISSITASISDSSVVTEEGFDAVIDIEKSVKISSSYLPEDSNKKTIKWFSSNEDIAKVDFDKDGNKIIKGISAGEVTIYAYNDENPAGLVKSNELKIKVNPLKAQNKEGAVYDLTFTSKIEDSILVNNALNNNLPVSVTGQKAVVQSGEYSSIWTKEDNVVVMNPSENGVGDSHIIYDFSDQQVSGISFYYGLYYNTGMANLSWLQQVKIETSNDGESWTTLDIKDEVISEISYENLKLMEKTFAPASKVKISLETNFIGKNIHFAFSEMAFIADESCASHVEHQDVPVSDITLSASKDSIYAGQTTKINALVSPSNATDPSLTWDSSNVEAATIDSNGVVTALDVEAATEVTFTATNVASGVTKSVTITINPKITLDTKLIGEWSGETDGIDVLNIVVKADNTLVAKLGDNDAVTLTLVDYAEHYFVFQDDDENVIYIKASSSMNNVADVKGNLGENTIAKFAGSREYNKIIPLESITLNVDSTRIKEGTSVILKTTLNPTDSTDTTLTYDSSDETIATVSAGTINALKPGNVTITVTSEGGVIGTLEIEVYAKTYPTKVTVSGEASATVGDKVQLSVTLNPTDVSEKAVTWSSSDSSIASVDKNGLVTCNGAGEVVISATAADGTTKGDFTISVSAGASVIPSASAGTYTGSDTYANDISVELLENGKLTFVNITYDNTYEFTFSEVNADGYYVFTCEGEVDLVFELTGTSIIYHGDDWSDSYGGVYMMEGTEYSK